MTPKEQGRFCDVCAKCVVDMTKMNPSQMKEVYEENAGNVCARVKPSQIETPFITEKVETDLEKLPVSLLSKIQKFAIAFAAAFGLLVLTQKAPAQNNSHVKMGKMAVYQGPVISGKVTYPDGNPASGINLWVMNGTDILATGQTNDYGFYNFRNLPLGKVELVLEKGNGTFDRKTLHLKSDSRENRDFVIKKEMVEEEVILGMMVELPPLVDNTHIKPEVLLTVEEEEKLMLGQMVVELDTSFGTYENKGKICGEINEEEMITTKGEMIMTIEPVRIEPIEQVQVQIEKVETGKEASSVIELMEIGLNVFPNPTRDVVRVQLESVPGNVFTVRLLGMKGQLISNREIEQGNEARVDLTGLSAGIYLIEVEAAGGVKGQRKIIKL